MQILKETFDRHGYSVLLHEKPFLGLNGSGKHANWSINYVKPNG
jgi:glutamine synthetase